MSAYQIGLAVRYDLRPVLVSRDAEFHVPETSSFVPLKLYMPELDIYINKIKLKT